MLDLLDPASASQARGMHSYRGIPVSDLARAFVAKGTSVVVVTVNYSNQSFRLFGDGLEIISVPYRGRPREQAMDLFKLERALLIEAIAGARPDVLHAHWTYEFALAALALDLPTVITVHDAPLTVLRHFRDPYRAMRAVMAIQVRLKKPNLAFVSPYLATKWHRQMLWPRGSPVIPNLVGLKPPQIPPPDTHSRIWITIGDSSPLKNLERLVRAWAIIRRSRPDLELHIVGPGLEGPPPSADHERSTRTAGVVWRGVLSRDELGNLLASAQGMVHPSLEESFGLAVAEGMVYGLPVVGGISSGAVPWLLSRGAGVLVNVHDERSIATAVLRLSEEPERRLALGNSAATRIQSLTDPATILSAYETLYRRAP